MENQVKLYSHIPEEGYISDGYGRGLAALREACLIDPNSAQPLFENQPRPLTPRESLIARVEDYNRLRNPDGSERTAEDRLKLFNKGFWTSTGMLYEYDGDMSVPMERREARIPRRAKIQGVCLELLRLSPEVLTENYLDVDFDSFEGEELDLTSGIWYQGLTRREVPEHEGWRKLVGDDEEGIRILNNYADIVFGEVQRLFKEITAMGFWKRREIKTNELRAPWVNYLVSRSSAFGNNLLFSNAAFLRASVPAPQR